MVMFFAPVNVPPTAEGHAADFGFRLDRVGGGELRQPAEERLPDFSRLFRVQSKMNHADFELVVRREVRLFAPMIVEESFAVEGNEAADEAAIGSSEEALTVKLAPPASSGRSRTRRVNLLTAPKVPPPPPFRAQNRSELVQEFAIRTLPSAVTTSASRRPAAAIP